MTTDTAEAWASPRAAWQQLRSPEDLDGPPQRHLDLWDALCRHRPVVAVGGLDAHQPGTRFRGRIRSVMPHPRWFRLLRTHLLLDAEPRGDATIDRAAVLDALRTGRCYLSLDHLGDPSGFAFAASRQDDHALMGDTVPAGAWTLTARAPAHCELHVLLDGVIIERGDQGRISAEVTAPGAYRVEAHRGGRRWIVSNPIYLR